MTRQQSRGQGYRLRIDADGQGALSRRLSPEQFQLFKQTCAVASTAGRFLDIRLHEISGRPVDSWRPSTTQIDDLTHATDMTANRQTLRQILMCGVEHHIQFSKTLQNFDVDAGAVMCFFEDGTTSRWHLLVAADGASSVVRRLVLPDAELHDMGDVSIYGKTFLTPETRPAIGEMLLDGLRSTADSGDAW